MARVFVAAYQPKTAYFYPERSTIKLKLLGVLAGFVAFPLIALLVLIGYVVPQKQWEEFWDDYSEL